jgi:hypothetical protein
MRNLTKTLRYSLYALLSIVFASCEGSSYYREKNGLINKYDRDYIIQSIRVDDDAEYHIVAVSKSGRVVTIKDAYADYDIDIKLRFGDYSEPILRKHFSDKVYGEGKFVSDNLPSVLLPYGYKIDTFDD